MLNFATARVGILGYKFENFEMYSNGRSESTFNCLRTIVLEHQKLIKYVENANESLKWYFFTEFLFKSYHITVSLLTSTDLSQRIFNSNWYDQSSEVKRSLLIVMARVQRPLVLTIGNFAVIDNDLIVTVNGQSGLYVRNVPHNLEVVKEWGVSF
ncbi:unnamed protein product [Phaedon cochleariae]|uniref:Uncharacterized protein n=1 Tax=Phaedon cochleariae TaxID=80249 RepID=A0A9N9SCW6_PHACE|nr:unnamed protein product [Phaedon cochleariae]